MRAIKHGNLYELETIVCENCKCEFTYNRTDIKNEQWTDRDAYGKDTYIVNLVKCPECNKDNRVFFNALAGEKT